MPLPNDGIKNGNETDIDCGGADPATPRCALGRACAQAKDCATRICTAGTCTTPAPSCTGALGTASCGAAADENCCASLSVPGGSYNRLNNAKYPATVSAFKLDTYEVTVGRIRAFFEAKGGDLRRNPPTPGAGAHPRVRNSGWRASFNVRLPGSWTEINERLGPAGCTTGGDNTDGGAATWTPKPGPFEDLPITCLDWYTFFAFCAWDGGRLPTDAEWGFAGSGGSEQRVYAWTQPGDPYYPQFTWGVHNDLVAAGLWDKAESSWKYSVGTPYPKEDPLTGKIIDGPAHIARPGMKTGRGRWGHADLSGNMLEYTLDLAPIPEGTCNDCAFVNWPDPPQDQVGWYPPNWWVGPPDPPENRVYPDGTRSLRGSSWNMHVPFVWFVYTYWISRTYSAAGARCARD